MGYYIGGDRTDDGNYTPSFSGKRRPTLSEEDEALLKESKVEFVLPKEFDYDYYRSKRDAYHHSSIEYHEWKCFERFSRAVYEFYRQVVRAYYGVFKQGISNLPNFEKSCLNLKEMDLDEMAENVERAEAELILQFSRGRRTIKAKLNKHATLNHLKDYAARAWVMYYALKKKLYFNDSINFKRAYQHYNLDDDKDKLRAFRGREMMKYKIHTNVPPNFLIVRFHHPSSIYEGVDNTAILNDLVKNAGGFTTDEYDTIISNEEMQSLNQKFGNLMIIYQDYGYINSLIASIRRIADYYYTSQINTYGIFIQRDREDSEDMYEQAKNYYELICDLSTKDYGEPFVFDLESLKQKLEDVLKFSKKAYVETKI